MVDIIERYIDLIGDFINYLFLFQIEFNPGEYLPVGKIVLAFLFIATSLYFILDAMGIIEGGGE